MRPRIYADTSVLGGCEDEEFREPSLRLLEAFVRGELTLVLSELTLRELDVAPTEVRRHVASVPEAHVEALSVSSEAEELAAAYIADGAVSERMLADALHIALASVARVDVRRIHAYNAVNLKNGYPLLEIRTPREVPGNE